MKSKIHYAAFREEVQLTPYRTDKNRVYTAIKRIFGLRHGVYVAPKSKRAKALGEIKIHSMRFFEN